MNRSVELNAIPAGEDHPLATIEREEAVRNGSCSSLSLRSVFPRAMHDSFKSLGDEVTVVQAKSTSVTSIPTSDKVAEAKYDAPESRSARQSSIAEMEAAIAALRSAVNIARRDFRECQRPRQSRSWSKRLNNESESALQERLANALDREVKSNAAVEALRTSVEELRSKRGALSEEVELHCRTMAEDRETAKELQAHLNSVVEASKRRRAAASQQKTSSGRVSSSPVRTREGGRILSRMASSIFGRVL